MKKQKLVSDARTFGSHLLYRMRDKGPFKLTKLKLNDERNVARGNCWRPRGSRNAVRMSGTRTDSGAESGCLYLSIPNCFAVDGDAVSGWIGVLVVTSLRNRKMVQLHQLFPMESNSSLAPVPVPTLQCTDRTRSDRPFLLRLFKEVMARHGNGPGRRANVTGVFSTDLTMRNRRRDHHGPHHGPAQNGAEWDDANAMTRHLWFATSLQRELGTFAGKCPVNACQEFSVQLSGSCPAHCGGVGSRVSRRDPDGQLVHLQRGIVTRGTSYGNSDILL